MRLFSKVMETALTELLNYKGDRVISIEPEATVLEAARTMKREKIGALLVMRGDKLLGILSERDILNRVVAEGRAPAEIPVHSVMTKEVVVIGPNRSVREAMQVVTDKHLRHLPVVKDGRLLGMLSGGDLTRSIVAEEEGVINTLYDYIYGTYPG